MKFYTFRQNNSGGSWDIDKKAGIGQFVIIEAENADHANERAESIGLYFNGEGDCECCGRRWSEVYDDDGGEDFPKAYGISIIPGNGKATAADYIYFIHPIAGEFYEGVKEID